MLKFKIYIASIVSDEIRNMQIAFKSLLQANEHTTKRLQGQINMLIHQNKELNERVKKLEKEKEII